MANFLREFRYVLSQGEDLPTLPSVVFELYAALNDETVSAQNIATVIERDPALTTRLLRLANSAAFNCGTPVGDVGSAIQILGIRQVRAMCVALSVSNMFAARDGGMVGPAFWDHSAGVAHTARSLSQILGITDVPAGELYVAALLHDVGILVLDQRFPEQLREAFDIAESCESSLWKGESILLATDHGEIGGLLLGRWDLPAPIVSMVTAHHNPKLAPEKYRNACWLIYAAEVICGGLGPAFEIERHSESRAARFLDHIREAGFDVETVTEEFDSDQSQLAAIIAE